MDNHLSNGSPLYSMCVRDEYLYSNSGIINFVIEYAYHHVSIPIISLNKIRLFMIFSYTHLNIQLVR